MPTNITSPNIALFTVQFTDQFGNPTNPSSASILLNYLFGGALTSSSADLTAIENGFWTYRWNSFGVDVPSDVQWQVFSSLSFPNPARTGVIRIIDP